MTELEMPSKVVDEKYVRMPKEEKVVDSDEEWDRCGKWLLHHPHMDMRFVDSAWTELQQLVDDGTLLMLKASTAKMEKEGATILCYTRPGKREAKRAAMAIRKVVNFLGILFYKVNKQTSQGIANRFGDKRVTIYMYTFLGMFYTRKNGAMVQDIEDGAENVPIASKFSKENYSGNYELPSNYKEYCYLNLPDQGEQIQCSNWYLFCSCEDEGGYLPEVDRVWIVAKQLFDEGLFVGVTLRKFEEAKCAEVRLYISQHCDAYSRLTACNRIFKEASCRTVMYFTEGVKRKPFQIGISSLDRGFEYTSGGEFYRVTGYGQEYLSL